MIFRSRRFCPLPALAIPLALAGCAKAPSASSNILGQISGRDDGLVRIVSAGSHLRLCDLFTSDGKVVLMSAASLAAADVDGRPKMLRFSGKSLPDGGTFSGDDIKISIRKPGMVMKYIRPETEVYVDVVRRGQVERFRATWSC